MATKHPEQCPKCGTETLPTDTPVDFEEQWGSFIVRLWRYHCSCGWIWANELQREHNALEYKKQKHKSRLNLGWGFN